MHRSDDYLWDPSAEPDPEIQGLETILRPLAYRRVPFQGDTVPRGTRRTGWRFLTVPLAAAAVLMLAVGGWLMSRNAPIPWAVESLTGAPHLEGSVVGQADRLRPGEWLETNGTSAARIAVGRIGTAEVGPHSRIRVVRAEGSEHRMELARGTMHARIWAPPRFFLVETPAALAVDLGCIYTLRVDSVGGGVLTVISGQVELVRSGRRSLVPAGNAAEMRPGAAPGTPYPVGSSPEFRGALQEMDFGSRTPEVLQKVLHEAHGPATITLWHLLPRLDSRARSQVVTRLAALAPLPPGVTREGVVALDAAMLQRWQQVLEPTWSTERLPVWKKSWRRIWSWYQSA